MVDDVIFSSQSKTVKLGRTWNSFKKTSDGFEPLRNAAERTNIIKNLMMIHVLQGGRRWLVSIQRLSTKPRVFFPKCGHGVCSNFLYKRMMPDVVRRILIF